VCVCVCVCVCVYLCRTCVIIGLRLVQSKWLKGTHDTNTVTQILLFLDLRLVGGSWNGEGRVEILHNGAWGTVCDDSWDINDARVVCRALRYPGAISAPQSAHFGQGSGDILLDDVQCLGTESALENCPHNGWNSHNCGHSEDASVICLSMYDYDISVGLSLTCVIASLCDSSFNHCNTWMRHS